jgi:hypothetical protein
VAAARPDVTEDTPGEAADDVAAARASIVQPEAGPAAVEVERARAQLETKALPGDDNGFEVTDTDFDTLAAAIEAALTALLDRQQGVIVARLHAPKIRKHTRFWQPENENDTRSGDANLDEDRVVSAARWAEETTNTLAPILQQAAAATARKMSQAVAGSETVPPAAVAPALVSAAHAGAAMTAFLADLVDVLHQAQTDPNLDLDTLKHMVGGFYNSAGPDLTTRVAETCAVSTINGAADAAAESAGPGVVRTWITRKDDRVRPAHRALQGKTLPVGTPYEIDGARLRYPGDPFAPFALTINCRCRLHYATDEDTN